MAGPTIQRLPRDIESVGRKAKQYGFPFTPDQTILNEYVGDQGIDPHTDLEDQFDDTVCSISLNGWASMVFTRPGFKTIRLMLEPGSLLMMKGECRYVWKHGIPKAWGEWDSQGNWWPRTRRVSVTLRKVVERKVRCPGDVGCVAKGR